MADYKTWNESALKRLMAGIRNLNAQPHSQPVYYSGPFDKQGTQVRNRLRAENYALREGATTLEMTDRGSRLEANKETIFADAIKLIPPSSALALGRMEWRQLSDHYAILSHGDIKAFVAGAGREDVFRATELPELILNSRVRTINGVSRQKLHKIVAAGTAEEDGHDRAYRMVALAHVRQETQQALRTGDRELIRDALAQKQLYENQLRLDEDKELDITYEAEKKREADLDRRADRLAAMRQATIRQEALQEAKSYIDQRLQQGAVTPEQAERMLSRAEQSAQDPQKAFRMRELAKLKRMRDAAIQGEPDIQGINNYINGRAEYEKDLRAVRQVNGQRFVASNPVERELGRHHLHRTLAEHASLKSRHRNGELADYAQAEAQLDQRLQDQKRLEAESAAKSLIQRPPARAAARGSHAYH